MRGEVGVLPLFSIEARQMRVCRELNSLPSFLAALVFDGRRRRDTLKRALLFYHTRAGGGWEKLDTRGYKQVDSAEGPAKKEKPWFKVGGISVDLFPAVHSHKGIGPPKFDKPGQTGWNSPCGGAFFLVLSPRPVAVHFPQRHPAKISAVSMCGR